MDMLLYTPETPACPQKIDLKSFASKILLQTNIEWKKAYMISAMSSVVVLA